MKPVRMDTPLRQVMDGEGRRHSWLAEQVGVSRIAVGNWIAGRSVPSEENQRKIAELLGRTVEELWPPDSEEAA